MIETKKVFLAKMTDEVQMLPIARFYVGSEPFITTAGIMGDYNADWSDGVVTLHSVKAHKLFYKFKLGAFN